MTANQPMRIAFQGALGAYSHEACLQARPDGIPVPCTTFEGVLRAVREGRADLAMLPVENTTYGRVADIHRLLPDSGMHIIEEAFVRVRIALMAQAGVGIEDVKHVRAHLVLLPQARAIGSIVPRIAATLGCFLLATPMFVTALTKPLDPLLPTATMARGAAAPIASETCDYGRLSGLTPGLVFLTMDDAPQQLGLTDHSVTSASYHRNQTAMADVITAFTSAPDEARAIIESYEADYVVACLSASDFALYRTADPENFANAIASDSPPRWLTPVGGFESGSLRVYRAR